jgi:succinate dehydrogenase / fumarate reductase cytochrome b subunit
MPGRPLSPHLGVYKLRYTMVSSILNRFAGVALSLALVPLVYWLVAVAGGAHQQAQAQRLLTQPLAKLVYAAVIAAFCYHLVAGIRHLVWDTGRYLEREQSRRSAYLVGLISSVLTIAVCYALWVGSRAP